MYEWEDSYRRGVVRPVQCVREGWQLIKEDYGTFLGISLVGVLLGSLVPLAILLGPMMCGIHLCLLGRMRGQRPSMNLLFKGFDHFVQSLIATLCMVVPIIAIFVPAYVVMLIVMFQGMPRPRVNAPPPRGAPDFRFFAVFAVFWLLIVVVSLAVQVLFFFIYPLIVDRRLSGIDAVKVSIKAAFANVGGVLGVTLLNALIAFLGTLCCYVGVIFVLPLNFAAIAIAYRQVFPDESEFDDIGDEPPNDQPRGNRSGTEIQAKSRQDRIK